MELKSLTVTFKDGMVVAVTPQEAFNLLMMPSLAGLIVNLVPEYGLPSVPEPENKE